MSRVVVILVVLAVACAIGYVVWLLTDSTSASYIVGVVGTALGAAALLSPEGRRFTAGVKSRVRVGTARKSRVTGARVTDKRDVDASVRVRNADDSEITGVTTEPTERRDGLPAAGKRERR